jgi:hypothetical protein
MKKDHLNFTLGDDKCSKVAHKCFLYSIDHHQQPPFHTTRPTNKKSPKLYKLDYTNLTMIEFKAKLKRWGRSFGIVVPMEKVQQENLNENTTIEIRITKKENPLKKHFGTHKFSRPIKDILNEGDRESWDE